MAGGGPEQSNGPVNAYLWTLEGGQTYLVIEGNGPMPAGVTGVDLSTIKLTEQGDANKPVDASQSPGIYGAVQGNEGAAIFP